MEQSWRKISCGIVVIVWLMGWCTSGIGWKILRKIVKNRLKNHEKSVKIDVQMGSGEVLERSWWSWGGVWRHLGQKPWKKDKKRTKIGPFWSFLGSFWSLGASKWGPGGHLGRVLGVLGSIWGGFGEIFGPSLSYFSAWAEYQKTLKNLRFFKVFGCFGVVGWDGWGILGGFGRCWLEVEWSWCIVGAKLRHVGSKMATKSAKMSQDGRT